MKKRFMAILVGASGLLSQESGDKEIRDEAIERAKKLNPSVPTLFIFESSALGRYASMPDIVEPIDPDFDETGDLPHRIIPGGWVI